jgi:uncharacterized protein (TIGR02145 family)
MVTGQKPYSTETLSAFQLQTKIVNEPLPLTGTNWDNLIQKATEKDSQHRYADISAFRSAWKKGNNDFNDLRVRGDKTVIEQQTEKPISKTPEGLIKPPGNGGLTVAVLIIILTMIAGHFIWKEYKGGKQVWQTKNLDVDRFRNGDPILEARTAEEWKAAGERKEPAWCYYDNETENGKKYGKLYNWYAVNDSRGLAPQGWHIPTDEEWTTLIDYLGGEEVAGGKMKTVSGWLNPNLSATNESGFSGLSGGLRFDNDGSFSGLGQTGYWWSSTISYSTVGLDRILYDSSPYVTRYQVDFPAGLSIRCLRN